MNQVDILIILVVVANGVAGAYRGLIMSAGDTISLIAGLGLSSLIYPVFAAVIGWVFGLSPTICGVIGFIIAAMLVVMLAGWGFSHLARHFEPPSSIGRPGGAFFGAILGVILAAVLTLASGILPGAAEPVRRSALGPGITSLVPRLHENMESVGLTLPKLVQLPANYRDEVSSMRGGLQFLRLNFTRLDGSMCIHCRTSVGFLGYRFARGTLMSPEFRCPNCGRTSDGCQTFQGFHTVYDECPVAAAQEGIEFDCGVWTNGWWTTPHGPCPVCGREYLPGGKKASAASPPPGSGRRSPPPHTTPGTWPAAAGRRSASA